MRAGGFTVQQALSVEAASVIKQAVQLARRRGHAQVTPLHVASIMLYSPTGLLRTACIDSQSHSQPLQCKALELCFNVALNRLPTSSSTGLLGAPQHPSISNALIAAFKRAQAHQRRGSIENQQQPLLAVKIEIQQLIVSILDDPSVSRVMREAGFSSTLVKTKLEENVSLGLCSRSPTSSTNKSTPSKENNSLLVLSSSSSPMLGQENLCKQIRVNDQARNEDVTGVIEKMMNKRTKSLVIIGEEVATVEGVVKGVMDKVNQGDVPDALKEVKFISLPLSSFKRISRGEVEQKLEDLIRCMKTFVDKGVVLYLGDLQWITDYRASDFGGRNYYCSVEHMIIELGRLAHGLGESGKFWLMGIGSFQTYMKCKSGHPSLEGVWGLCPLTVPAAGLGLSLITDSYVKDKERGSKNDGNRSSLVLIEDSEEPQLTCCADCSANFETEAQSSRNTSSQGESTSSTLPSWLRNNGSDDQENVWIKDLCKKWNSFCRSSHTQSQSYEKTTAYSSSIISPSSSASFFYSDQQNPNFHPCSRNTRMYIPENGRLSNPSSALNSNSSSDNMEMEYISKFKEFNAENLKTLCRALEEKVPLQKDVIAEIAGTILQCRSGMLRRKEKGRCFTKAAPKEETWLFIQGMDKDAKEKFARELAKLVFGPSHSNFKSISLSNFSSTRADSIEDFRNKRLRDEQSCSLFERLTEAMSVNPHRVFFIEDVEQADHRSQMGIKRAIQSGKIRNADGEDVSLGDSIIILSCESFSSRSRACSPSTKQKSGRTEEEKSVSKSEETSPCTSLDLNVSFEGDDSADMLIDDVGDLVESVDRYIIFKMI
ncbi:hypothetical protein DCAR_0625637 [Daucus carota subsp. sativus]|uniref:Clp R domain-containing protein n=2 Tax=Daucus carota subsp. sativus TaxID=79200 RepID=A0AAF1B4E0_DAUCS|nr:PREDICTED: protein SMAX1-LIKE 3-like [Daucus carota subsp. sativus]XP_017255916.1 PREDICTED: protein SMAX1-LIKE 3-like [Daucus carota subsp. sativus]WOH06214.1 hypothetical protein DCAR_0625637 [Daucus carota subsp. sativus]